jgi:hypothetical protein
MMISTNFSQAWFFLQQESYLIASCIGGGLTAVRKAPWDKGEWYNSFFQLSIGLERLMKAIIIVDHINRGQIHTLTKDDLKKKFGHNLITQFTHVGTISVPATPPSAAVPTVPNPVSVVSHSSTGYAILEFLSKFGVGTRYHNLDSLVSAPTGVDPLTDWKTILDRILSEDVTQRRLDKVAFESDLMAHRAASGVVVISHGLDKTPLDLKGMFQNGPLQNEAARFVVFHLLEIIRPLVECLSDLCHAAYYVPTSDVPEMQEALTFAMVDEKRLILDKKLWGRAHP